MFCSVALILPTGMPPPQHPLLLLTAVDCLERATWGSSLLEVAEQLETVAEGGQDAGILLQETGFDTITFARVSAAAARATELPPDPDSGYPPDRSRSLAAALSSVLAAAHMACSSSCRDGVGHGSRTAGEMVALASPLLHKRSAAPRISELIQLIDAVKAAPNVDMRGASPEVVERYAG